MQTREINETKATERGLFNSYSANANEINSEYSQPTNNVMYARSLLLKVVNLFL